MNKINSKFVLGLTAATATLAGGFVMTTLPAQALTWTVNATFPVGQTLSGTFDIDNEAMAGASLTAVSLSTSPGLLSFSVGDFLGFGPNDPNLGNDITTLVFNNGLNNLTLEFTSALTSGGGLRTLNAAGSDFDGDPISGSANGATSGGGGGTSSVPFDFSTTPGLIALGLIVGGNHAWKKWKNKN